LKVRTAHRVSSRATVQLTPCSDVGLFRQIAFALRMALAHALRDLL
jgi:hypothetical protein